jgi:hypothetical protein
MTSACLGRHQHLPLAVFLADDAPSPELGALLYELSGEAMPERYRRHAAALADWVREKQDQRAVR